MMNGMVAQTLSEPTSVLSPDEDETGWLEHTAELVKQGQWSDIDSAHLAEYLIDMAIADRRQVNTRLKVLLTHLLKWEYQPAMRSRSWKATILTQRDELEDLLHSATLRRHAEEKLNDIYARAVRQASVETGLEPQSFPSECSYSID